MTAAPYTLETIRDIRTMANKGASAAQVLRKLGWDEEFLGRICKRHQIEFSWVPSGIVVPPAAPVRALATRATSVPAQKERPATPEEVKASRSKPRSKKGQWGEGRYNQLAFSSTPELSDAVRARAKALGITRSEFLFRLVSAIHARNMWGDVLSSLRPADLGGDEMRNCISSVASVPKETLKQK